MTELINDNGCDSIYYTKYRVSTITCNADIGNNINLDLKILFNNILILNDINNFVWIQYLNDDNDNFRGIYPKKKRKVKTSVKVKTKFDNQVTVIYKYSSEYMPNVKIFKNGNIQLTGIRDINDTEKIVNSIIDNVKTIYKNNKGIILTDYTDINPDSRLMYSNFKIRMINTDFKIYTSENMQEKYNIRRKELHNILISDKYNNKSSFQPGIYQGVKLEYFWNKNNANNNGICYCTENCFGKNSGKGNGNCKKVTIAIFESGSILITGGITFEQVDDSYKYICNVINDNKLQIRKPVFSEIINS
jgi:TATA-box binding protein (TBP) (component of TFIID and TFIIIB)